MNELMICKFECKVTQNFAYLQIFFAENANLFAYVIFFL